MSDALAYWLKQKPKRMSLSRREYGVGVARKKIEEFYATPFGQALWACQRRDAERLLKARGVK